MKKTDALFKQSIQWEIDPSRYLWLRAASASGVLHLRINSAFPDGPAYCLVLADGAEHEFDDFPEAWLRPPLKWPDSARR
jgi:hypothetical protein